MKVVAIITARGGSKGVPKKNLKLLNGRPLIEYTIDAAIHSNCFKEVFLTTEDDEIAQRGFQKGIKVHKRPLSLAKDDSSSVDVVIDLLKAYPEFDVFVLLQPTSPLRTSHHIQEAIELYKQKQANSLISVRTAQDHPYKTFISDVKGELKPLLGKEQLFMPRQSLPNCHVQNGAIYIASVKKFLEHKSFFIEPAQAFVMNQIESIDIDTLEDFLDCEKFLKEKNEVKK